MAKQQQTGAWAAGWRVASDHPLYVPCLGGCKPRSKLEPADDQGRKLVAIRAPNGEPWCFECWRAREAT